MKPQKKNAFHKIY